MWFLHATDPHQLETAILNLAINARDAMPSGGTLTLSTRRTARSGRRWSLPAGARRPAITCAHIGPPDTGIGMPPEIMSRIFEPFFTPPTKEVGKGTGLGLSQVYGFAKQSGGFVAIESTLGQGATLLIHLPRADPVETAVEHLWRPVVHANGQGTVLVVEDDIGVRATTKGSVSGYRLRKGYRSVDRTRGAGHR